MDGPGSLSYGVKSDSKKTDSTRYGLNVESKKVVQRNCFTKQK